MKKFLLFAIILTISIVALCACEDKKEENKESGNTSVVENENNQEIVLKEKTPETIGQYTVVYNGLDFGPGVYYDKIKDELGQETKPSDTSKPCGPNVKGEVTHHYYDGFTIDVNYMGMIIYVSIDSDTVALSCGAKVGMTAEEVKALVENETEYDYSINVVPADSYYVTFIKADDGTISHISTEDISIEV